MIRSETPHEEANYCEVNDKLKRRRIRLSDPHQSLRKMLQAHQESKTYVASPVHQANTSPTHQYHYPLPRGPPTEHLAQPTSSTPRHRASLRLPRLQMPLLHLRLEFSILKRDVLAIIRLQNRAHVVRAMDRDRFSPQSQHLVKRWGGGDVHSRKGMRFTSPARRSFSPFHLGMITAFSGCSLRCSGRVSIATTFDRSRFR